ncbi:hypothetical protein NXV57_30250 [Bacteroides thetaiotaomicron]|nr:hypothetical protein [Bacteroides thetaiotaomicron]
MFGLISLLIFSLSSYPFQILPFLMLGTLLLSICVSDFERGEKFGFQCIHALLLPVALFGGNVLCIYEVRNVNELSERLYYIKVLQDQALEKEASTGYSRLYDSFKHNFNFLMKYANSLFAQKDTMKQLLF